MSWINFDDGFVELLNVPGHHQPAVALQAG
jgi:hypothetical protein